ncbi:MAG: hypothetical protein ACRYGF_07265 [Janthinobacterium lividum]
MQFGCSVIFGLLLAVAAPSQPHWQQYANARFQYSICFPETVLKAQPEAENSDGRAFLGNDGARLLVYGSEALRQTLAGHEAETSADLAGKAGKVTYEKHTLTWYVLSGTSGDTIFYAKTYRSHGQFKSFRLTYPASAASTYNPIAAHLSQCFKDLAGQ